MSKQYHIGLERGELARFVLLVGDPARAHKTAKVFNEVSTHVENREFVTYTGVVGDIPLSVMSTGIGPDNMEIALLEALQIVDDPTFVRVGSCGGIQGFIDCGDLVISTAAVRLENTSLSFVPQGYPATASYEVVLALVEGCERLGLKYHVGLTATAPGFYGAQGRIVEGIPSKHEGIVEELRERRVLNFEMESSTLFSLASVRGLRSGTVCAVFVNRITNEFVDQEKKDRAEMSCIKAGVQAVRILAEFDEDKQRTGKPHWHRGLAR